MSRTDKDRPYWLADKYEAVHWHHYHRYRGTTCDLPEELPRENYWLRRTTYCYWKPIHPRPFWGKHSTKVDRRVYWHGPERAKVRTQTQRVIADFNTNGDTELEIRTFQHRHGVDWDMF